LDYEHISGTNYARNPRFDCISFGTITGVYLRITLLWDMKLCQWVVGSWRFEATYCPHLQGYE
jgi:hypothetical protein